MAIRISGGMVPVMIGSESEQPVDTIPYFKQSCPTFKCFVLLEFLLRVCWEKKRLPELKALYLLACCLGQ